MRELGTLIQSLPQSIISLIYGQYHSWMADKSIPAFHSELGPLRFKSGRIFLNNQDLETLVAEPRPHWNMSFWLGMSDILAMYGRWYYKEVQKRKKSGELNEAEFTELDEELLGFQHCVYELLSKVYRKLKRRFDETTDGLAFHLDEDGTLTVNGIKVETFLQMAERYPTAKARTFLKGLKNRLAIILKNRSANADYDKVREISFELFAEIDRLLETSQANGVRLIAAHSG